MKKDVMFQLVNGSKMRINAIKSNILKISISNKEIENKGTVIMDEIAYTEIGFSKYHSDQRYAYVATEALDVSVSLIDGAVAISEKEADAPFFYSSKAVLTTIPVMRYDTGFEEPVIERIKTVDGERSFIKNLKETVDHYAYNAKVYLRFDKEEGIYGLGQGEDGIYNYRGKQQYLYQHNMRIPMPILYSDKGYGILFDCGSLMSFRDGDEGTCIDMDAVKQIDYYVIAGKNPDGFIDGIRTLTGKAAMLPKWAFGYIQSKEQYYTAIELKEVIQKYRMLNVPIDCVVQDWNTWQEGMWGDKNVDPARYGDLKEQLEEVKKMHAHAMVSVWPNMNAGGENHTEFQKSGYLLNDYSTYDAFNESARKMYFKQAKKELFSGGFEAWWCDSTEPFSGPDWTGEIKKEPEERFALVGGEHKKYLPWEKANLYALMHAKGIFENQRKETEDIRVMNLTRSGYPSAQKYAAVLWSGDICASYDTLKKQITEGLNVSLSGYPYWTLDIGGFFTVGSKWQNRGCGCNQDSTPKWFWKGDYNEGIHDDAYKELYVRWLQMGVFLPIFRSHGTDTPREIWNFGKKGQSFYDAIEKFIRLRYLLMPYIYSMAGGVRFYNETIMRSFLFDFSYDKEAVKIHDEFMFGKSILVCPVTEPMYYESENRPIFHNKIRNCYLPSGIGWYHFFTNEYYEGGKNYSVKAPIDTLPVFVREGSIIPMKDGLNYAQDKEDAPMEIHIYPGADATFNLYEDEGNNYQYENGKYSFIEFTWKDKLNTLIVGNRIGSFQGMKQEREFEIYILNERMGTMLYNGKEQDFYI